MSTDITRRIGRYEIYAEVGEGSFGKVYRAWDPEFERWVAIKELTGQQQAEDGEHFNEHLERFKLERRIQGRFQHPHIVSVYDMVEQDGNEYLVEEFVAGGTLYERIQKEGKLAAEDVVQIGIEMCQAISIAWEEDIVHRDIKPSNILLTEENHAKLSDFGIAQLGQMSQRTQTYAFHPGTPAYKSPEQERAHGYLDERSDLYALGLVLYEALTGAHYKRERVSPKQLNPDIPKPLAQAIMKALAQEPAERYQHAAEFAEDLRHALDKRRDLIVIGIGSVLTLLGLIIIAQGYFSARQAATTPAQTATPTTTSIPASPTKAQATATATRMPSLNTTITPTKMPVPTSTARPIRTSNSTPGKPVLVSPESGTQLNTALIVLQWKGSLPDSSYGYRVTLYHNNTTHHSPVLEGTSWQSFLPGDDTWGEWNWWVSLVRRTQPQNTLAGSDTWTFYYDPFGGDPHNTSPVYLISALPTPSP